MASCADGYESEGRLFESAWAHPRKPSDSLTHAPSVPLRQPALSASVTGLVTTDSCLSPRERSLIAQIGLIGLAVQLCTMLRERVASN
jgi:hypothetical protein